MNPRDNPYGQQPENQRRQPERPPGPADREQQPPAEPPQQRGQPAQQAPPQQQQQQQPPAQQAPQGQFQNEPPQGQMRGQGAGQAGAQRPPRPQGTAPQQQPPGRPAGRQPRLEPTTLEAVVQTDVATAQRDTPITDVVSQMADQDVGSVVVIEDDSPVGVLTDRTIALALQDEPDVGELEAGDLISDGDLVMATVEMTIFDALQQLSDANVRRLPVVDDDDGQLEGIVTLDDMLVLLGEAFDRATGVIEAQSPRL